MNQRTIKITQYYSCQRHMEKLFEQEKQNAFCATSKEEYGVWQRETRSVLEKRIGLDKMENCPLDEKVLEKQYIGDGIWREKVVIQVEPEVYMPFFILIPETIKEREINCFLALPGHMGAGKFSVAGCEDIPAVKEQIDIFHYDYGLKLAQLGYVSVCPDIRGFGERREPDLQGDDDTSFINGSCYQLAHMAEPLGQTVTGMNVWDMMRLLDYLQGRKEWNTEKFGCVGFSGGGLLTLWLSALDDRIQKILISGYMYGYKDSLLELNGNCSCNYIPNLWKHVDMGDIGALLAPKQVLIQSCKEDHLNGRRGLANVYEQLDIMKRAYQLLEQPAKLRHDIREGGHCFHSEPLKDFVESEN